MASSPLEIFSAGRTATGWRNRQRPHGTGCSIWQMTVRLIKQPVKSLPVSHRDPKLKFSLPDRVYAAGRTCEKTWRRGHHPVHPGEALQTDGEPGISVLSETGCQPVQWVKRISWFIPYFALVFDECLVCLHFTLMIAAFKLHELSSRFQCYLLTFLFLTF